MRADISSKGQLSIYPESELEHYAAVKWFKDYNDEHSANASLSIEPLPPIVESEVMKTKALVWEHWDKLRKEHCQGVCTANLNPADCEMHEDTYGCLDCGNFDMTKDPDER